MCVMAAFAQGSQNSLVVCLRPAGNFCVTNRGVCAINVKSLCYFRGIRALNSSLDVRNSCFLIIIIIFIIIPTEGEIFGRLSIDAIEQHTHGSILLKDIIYKFVSSGHK